MGRGLFVLFWDRVFLFCSSSWPRTYYKDQLGPELRDPAASVSQMLASFSFWKSLSKFPRLALNFLWVSGRPWNGELCFSLLSSYNYRCISMGPETLNKKRRGMVVNGEGLEGGWSIGRYWSLSLNLWGKVVARWRVSQGRYLGYFKVEGWDCSSCLLPFLLHFFLDRVSLYSLGWFEAPKLKWASCLSLLSAESIGIYHCA